MNIKHVLTSIECSSKVGKKEWVGVYNRDPVHCVLQFFALGSKNCKDKKFLTTLAANTIYDYLVLSFMDSEGSDK